MGRLACVLLLCVACGNITRKADDAGVQKDAPSIDAPSPDAQMVGQSREIVSGAGRASSATYQLDMEVGHAIQQKKTSSATYTLEGNASVKP